MCGIAGIIGTSDQKFIDSMLARLRQRGPDATGSYVSSNFFPCTLGHARLSIIDLSEAANQPMFNREGDIGILFNGEILNYQELRDKIKDRVSFSTQSDTEVLLKYYELFGPTFFNQLIGMFAFVIVDQRRGEAHLVRDQFGIRPLYYLRDPRAGLVFASEVRSILASSFGSRELDIGSLFDSVTWGAVISPKTIFKDIKSLLPGEHLVYKNSTVTARRWVEHDLYGGPEVEVDDPEGFLREKFAEAVRRNFVADVPVGIFLSGGLDSSILLAASNQLGFRNINTFSIAYQATGREQDETSFAKILAERMAANHHEVYIDRTGILADLESFLDSIDQPTHDGFNTFLISKYAAQFGKVALSGLGGDELFGGYRHYRRLITLSGGSSFFSSRTLSRLGLRLAGAKSEKLQKFGKALHLAQGTLCEGYDTLRMLFGPAQWGKLFNELPIGSLITRSQNLLDRGHLSAELDDFQRISTLDFRYYLDNVLLRDTDVFGLKFALEIRPPYLDSGFVAAVTSLPTRLKYNLYDSPKQLLKRSYKDLLPAEIYNKPKTGFTLPMGSWLKKEGRPLLDRYLDETRIRNRGLLNVDYVRQLKARFIDGSTPEIKYLPIWNLVVVEAFLERYLGKISLKDSIP